MERRIDISHKTVIFVTIFLLSLWLLYQIKEVIILFFIAIIFMSALAPLVERLESYRLPKMLAIGLTYILVVVIFALLIALVIKPLAVQIPNMVTTLSHLVENYLPTGVVDKTVLQSELTKISRSALGLTLTVFADIITLISVAVLTFYLLLEKDRVEKLLSQLFVHHEERAKRVIQRVEFKLGAWLRGQIILTLSIGVSVYLLLLLLGIPYSLPLAILAGLMEVIPVIGPIISAIPAVLLAATISPILALSVAGGFFVIQQTENHILIPQIMKKAVGLNPLIVILAIAIGGKLLGVSGAFLAVPITVVLQLVAQEALGRDLS